MEGSYDYLDVTTDVRDEARRARCLSHALDTVGADTTASNAIEAAKLYETYLKGEGQQ